MFISSFSQTQGKLNSKTKEKYHIFSTNSNVIVVISFAIYRSNNCIFDNSFFLKIGSTLARLKPFIL